MKSDNIVNINSLSTNVDSTLRHVKTEKVVLVGNPNVGKSCVFNYLSGKYVDVSNYPGTTISITRCNYKGKKVYDTPGIYGVSSFNEEEKVARDIILESDVVINIVNSLHLERDLFLTLQLIDMGKKVSVILNFADELKKRKIKIDTKKLSDLLGVDVYETSAVNKVGLDQLDKAIENARVGNQQLDLHFLMQQYIEEGIPQSEALLILEGDEFTTSKYNKPINKDDREKIYITRRNRVNEIIDIVEHEDSRKGEISNLLGRMSLNPITGIPILFFILTLVYFFIGDFVSQRVVNFTENTVGVGIVEYNVKSFVSNFTSSIIDVEIFDKNENLIDKKIYNFPDGMRGNPELKSDFESFSSQPGAQTKFHFSNPIVKLFFGEFGVITMTTTYLLFLLLPLVIGFYFVMALLEDSGYLPRLATMLDRTFNKIGLNGKAVIPIILGFGCITMANITTRLLGSERERSIATAILQFVIPCSAQLAVITVLLSGAGLYPLLIFVGVIGSLLIILSTILNKLIPGQSSPLLIDLPIMRIPRLTNVLKKMAYRTYGFMKEAGFWFFVGALAVGLMDITGLLLIWQDILAPLTTHWLKLPKEAANAFVMGMVRRDFGAAGLFTMNLTVMQITVAIITITIFTPCIASFVVMLKERGWKEGITIWLGTWVTAFFIGGLVAQFIV
ncbi:FeoB small GTPase domain-containing protein [Melioribacter sp. OK-6-Me]|uniref:FeoB small GTPase domain-containing protein n=1 Tax=Melioribacter sp. OK-6-Me TaxID=3423433 RepID=UPI003ED91FB4